MLCAGVTVIFRNINGQGDMVRLQRCSMNNSNKILLVEGAVLLTNHMP